MLGSDHEGEQLNALRFIKRIAAEEKKTLAELLLSGRERIVYVDKIVYRDKPQQPYRRDYYGRYRDYSSRFEERDDGGQTESRELLDALKKAGEEAADTLDFQDLDFARTVPYEYQFDYELSARQVRYAKMIIKRARRATAEPPI